MLNALLIANAKSGAGRKLSRVNVPGRWIHDPATVTSEDVENSDLIALFGGDGTMQMTLSQILRTLPANSLPPIAVLPFGTTNMNARDLNRAQSPRATAASLERAIRSGQLETTRRPLVRISDGDRVEHGFFFGIGVIAEVIERWNADRKPGALANQLRSLWAMATGLSAVSSVSHICLNGEHHAVYGLLVTTLDRLLFGSTPYWGDQPPGCLRVTWVEADAPGLLRHAPALLRGKALLARAPGYESLSAEQVRLDLTGPYVVDGEIFHPQGRSLTIERSVPIRWVVL